MLCLALLPSGFDRVLGLTETANEKEAIASTLACLSLYIQVKQ